LAFALMGASQAVYGPLLPGWGARFALVEWQAGLLPSALFSGSVLAILLAGRGWLSLLAAFGFMATGAGLLALSLGYWWVLVGSVAIGVGFGGLSLGINSRFTVLGPGFLNFLNACFGIGSVLGPLVLSWVSLQYSLIFAVIAVLALIAIPLMLSVPALVQNNTVATLDRPQHQLSPLLWVVFIGLFISYTITEVGTANWQSSHLALQGFSPGQSAGYVALFWGAITLGRLLMAFASKIPITIVLLLAWSGAALSLFAAQWTVLGYIACGFFLAPVFPNNVLWFSYFSRDPRHTSFAIAAANAGGVIGPPLVGALIDLLGASNIPFILSAFAVAGLLLSFGIVRLTPQPQQVAA
jgi:MFS transporter, FHS family, glucose/mannose:H+ symporter